MNIQQQKLLIEQIDRRIGEMKLLSELSPPSSGWIHTIRKALKMSLRQLGQRLEISAQSVKEMEQREMDGRITLKSLNEVANALEMRVVYAVVPKNESLEKMIEKKALEIAREIVLRTSNTMLLEDQENSKERIERAIQEKAKIIIDTMPKYLWE